MDTNEKLSYFYKYRIDTKIKNLININYVYGGQTERSLADRQREHEYDDPNFHNMSIEPIFSSSKESQLNQINLAEVYLIEQLYNNFGDKCLNIAQYGGWSQYHNEGNKHTIYLMYK